LTIFASSVVIHMRFFRQTILSVCLILPFAVLGQPLATPDDASTPEDTGVVFNIVSNDDATPNTIDPATVDLDVSTPLTEDKVITTPEGEFSVDDLGVVTFVPLLNFFGDATILYTVKNDEVVPQTSNQALITVAVTPVNDIPTITAIADQVISQNSQTGLLAFTVGDVETVPGSLIVTGGSDNLTLVPLTGIAIAGAGAAKTVQVTPAAGQTGIANITITVNDGVDNAQTTFRLTVNAPPTITAITNQIITENTQTGLLAFTVGDAETPPGSLIVTGGSDNLALVPLSGIAIAGAGAAKTVQVTPAAGQTGIANITLTVSDGVDIAQTTFQLTVNPLVNTPPTITSISNVTISEDTQTSNLAFTIGDLETAPGLLTVTGSSSNATLVPNSNFVFGGSDANRTVRIFPSANNFGVTTITLTVSDGTNSTQTAFQLTVDPVNDVPTISSVGDQTIDEDTQTAQLTFNIGDVETAPTLLTVTGSSSNTTVVPNAGVVLGGSGTTRTVQVTPSPNAFGITTITLTVSDGVNNAQTTFQLTVTGVDDTPTISEIADQIIDENTQTGPLPFTIGDVETPASLLTLTPISSNTTLVTNSNVLLGGSGSLRSVNVIPTINQAGSTVITLTVNDGVKTAQTVFQVLVTEVDAQPIIVSSVPNQTIYEDTSTGVLNFTIDDPDTPLADLVVTATSSDQAVIPDANIDLGGTDGNRTVEVTPLANQNGGPVTITITVSDGVEFVDMPFLVTVTPVNDAPVFTKGLDQSILEDAGAQSVTNWTTGFNDGDEGGQVLTFIVTNNNNALFSVQPSINASGTLSYTPAPNAFGLATVSVSLRDNGSSTPPNVNTSGVQTFTINIAAINDAPVFTKGANQSVVEDSGPQSVLNWATGINDGDGGGQVLTFNVTNDNNAFFTVQPSISASGTLTYTPAPNAFGLATVSVTLSDNGSSSPPNVNTSGVQTFTINITAVNDPPTISTIADQVIDEDGSTGALAFTVGDLETAATALTVTRASTNVALIPVANVVLGGTGANRTVTVTPLPNQFGSSTITLNVFDGTVSIPTSFLVTVNAVNDAPTITNIAAQVIDENTSTGPLAFTVGDVETAAASLIVTGSSSNTTIVPNGNVVIGGSGASRTVNVTPAANQSGVVTITVNVSDGTTITPMNFQLTINAVNDPPTISAIGTQTINEDTQTGNIAFTIGDPETAPGSLIVTAASSNTTLVPTGNISLGGSGANRTINVTPVANLFGSATITISVSDGVNTTLRPFLVVVNSVNDAPTVTSIANQTIAENTATGALAFTIGDVETAPGSLTIARVSSNTALVPTANVVLGGSGANRTVTITPVTNVFGTTTITLNVSDGTDTTPIIFQVTVTEVNDPPTITTIATQNTNEDTPTSALSFTIGDPETPAASLVLTASSSNTTLVPNTNITFGGSGASRNVTVTPDVNKNGTTIITINVSDGVNTTSTNFTLNVIAVNDAPTISAIADQAINEDTQTGNLAFTIGDAETAAASLVVTASSSNTTVVPNGNITLGGSGISRTINISPAANQSGTTIITINVSDGVLNTQETFQVVVSPVNDPPTITAIADQTIAEDGTTGALNFTVGDVETPAGSLTVTRSSSNTALVPIANVVLGGSGAARTVTVTPALNAFGVTTITVTVSDGTATSEINFDVTVTAVNDPPTITSITDRIINEDSQTGTIPFTISDPETAAASLVVTRSSSNTTIVPNGNVVIAGSGATQTVNVIPAANQFGTVTITLGVSDGVTTTTTTFQVTINPVNDAPLITNQVPITVNEVQPVTLAVTQLTIVDVDNTYPGDFTLFVLGGPNYTVTGTTVTPVPNFSGTLTVPVFVSDGVANSPFYNVQISVNSTNDAPLITGQQALTINEDQTIALALTNLTVTDPDNVYPTDFTLIVLPGANYTFTGTTVTPATNYNGTLVVSVKVNDGALDSPPYNLQITITPVNDPPRITAQSPLSTNEDTPITLVISNFTVVDPEPTTYTLTVAPAAGTNYTVSGNTVTPNANYFGNISVPVTVSDGFLNSVVFNAQIQIIPVNDPPVIVGQTSLSTIEDTPITLLLTDLTVTDVDNPGYPTGFTLNIQAGTNYTFSGATVTPTLDFVGTIFVNVRVNDGASNSTTFPVQIEVTPASDAPVITGQNPVSMDEDASKTIQVSDLIIEDPDTPISQQTLTVLTGTNYTVAGNTVTPAANFFGTLTVRVRVNDGTANSNIYPLQVTVNPVNDLPSFSAIANVTIAEDAPLQSMVINNISPGPMETQQLLLTLVSDNTSLIPLPIVTPAYNGTATMATFTFKPEPNMFGTATITVRVVDTDFGTFERTFTITVTPVNDAPTLDAISVAPIVEDAPLQIIPLTGISAGGGAGESAQVLSFILSTNKPELFDVFEVVYTSPQGTASLRILLKPNANGSAQITLRLSDDGPGSPAPNVNFVIQTFTLVITPVNDLPVFQSVPIELAEAGVLYTYAIVATDADGQVITLTAPTKPAWMTFKLGTNGKATLSGTPPVGTTGSVDIVIIAKDPSGEPVEQSYTLSINSRPVLSPISITLNEDIPYTFTLQDFAAGFSDADGNPLDELEITELPDRGILKLNNTAVTVGDKIPASSIALLTYTPLADSTGMDTLRWSAADGFQLYSLEDTYALFNVVPSNDPPIISVIESDSLKYELGSEIPVFLTPTFDGYDPDGDDLTGAEIGFLRIDAFRYSAENDVLLFQGTPKITGSYDDAAGVLTLSGKATAKEYVDAIRSIKYNYIDAKELLFDPRSVSITLSDGQSKSLQKERIVKLIYTFKDLDIPTAFTPNGDSANETWQISAANGTELYSNAEINVYNKRGRLLFHTMGFDTPWNGVFDGEVLPSDTYYYTIDLKYNKVRYKGTVTILR